MSEILNIENFLKPISSDFPSGKDIRQETLYFETKAARTHARKIEKEGIENWGQTKKDWEIIFKNSCEILTSLSKDLEVASWLLESLVRREGFPGLRDGFKLIQGLVNTFWESLYPLVDENGIYTRVAPLRNLNGEDKEGVLILPITNISITQGGSLGPFALWQYQQAKTLEKISDPEQREKKFEVLGITLEEFNTSIKETSPDFFKDLLENIQEALNAYKDLIVSLDEKCGKDSPPSSYILKKIEEIQDTVKFISRDILPFSSSQEKDETTTKNEKIINSSLGLKSREEAFQSLQNVAQFFQQTEPQSLFPYMLERIIKWGKLPFPQLMTELIGDESSRKQLYHLVGVENKEKS